MHKTALIMFLNRIYQVMRTQSSTGVSTRCSTTWSHILDSTRAQLCDPELAKIEANVTIFNKPTEFLFTGKSILVIQTAEKQSVFSDYNLMPKWDRQQEIIQEQPKKGLVGIQRAQWPIDVE